MARKHKREADRSAWVISGFLPSLERPANLSLLLEQPVDLSLYLSDQRIFAFSPKLQTLYIYKLWKICITRKSWQFMSRKVGRLINVVRPYISFQVPCRNINILFTHIFFCLWLVIGTYILPGFFPVICWSYQWMEISVLLSIGNKLYSHHHHLFFSFLWNHFDHVILRLCWIC